MTYLIISIIIYRIPLIIHNFFRNLQIKYINDNLTFVEVFKIIANILNHLKLFKDFFNTLEEISFYITIHLQSSITLVKLNGIK